uniref:Uncharacterized protein n=1 Tax=Panagrellus redivivus TaxID=6233 RepID=A0A7E4WDU7_PANRE
MMTNPGMDGSPKNECLRPEGNFRFCAPNTVYCLEAKLTEATMPLACPIGRESGFELILCVFLCCVRRLHAPSGLSVRFGSTFTPFVPFDFVLFDLYDITP